MAQGSVRKCSRDKYSNTIGISDENPILDSRKYVVVFKYGTETEVAANTIAQSMYAQCDPDGNTHVLFECITNLRWITNALCYADHTVKKVDGRTFLRQSTFRWKLCVLWKDSFTSWENLSDLMDSHPLETVEYAVSQSLERDPAFN